MGWFRNLVKNIGKQRKLGDILTVQDLDRSNMKLEYLSTRAEIQGKGFFYRVGVKGVIVSENRAYFLNLKEPDKPEFISSSRLQRDTMYATQFLGYFKNYALFGIGYDGIEVIDINDILSPKSVGLIKDLGSPRKIIFHENLCITGKGVFDVADLLRPRSLHEFDDPAYDFHVVGKYLIYATSGKIRVMKLQELDESDVDSTFTHDFLHGLSRIEYIDDKYLLAASDGIGIIELSSDGGGVSLKTLIHIEVTPDYFVKAGDFVFTRTIPYWGNNLLAFDMREPSRPKLMYVLDTKAMWYFAANEKYVVYKGGEGTDPRSQELLLTVLSNHCDSSPEFIDSIKLEPSSDFFLVDNVIYVFTQQGLKLYKIS
jgi:hypothetical protein